MEGESHSVRKELPQEKEERVERLGRAEAWQLEFGELREGGLVVDSDQAAEQAEARSYGTWVFINGTWTNFPQSMNFIRRHLKKKKTLFWWLHGEQTEGE